MGVNVAAHTSHIFRECPPPLDTNTSVNDFLLTIKAVHLSPILTAANRIIILYGHGHFIENNLTKSLRWGKRIPPKLGTGVVATW